MDVDHHGWTTEWSKHMQWENIVATLVDSKLKWLQVKYIIMLCIICNMYINDEICSSSFELKLS